MVWHCCDAAPAEVAALAVNREEWLLQQTGVSQSDAGGEKSLRAPAMECETRFKTHLTTPTCLAEGSVVGGPDSSSPYVSGRRAAI
jgi:hypothetical protein